MTTESKINDMKKLLDNHAGKRERERESVNEIDILCFTWDGETIRTKRTSR